MTDKQPRNKKVPPVGLRPGQDFYTPKSHQANNFPTVGMTLRSYNNGGQNSFPNSRHTGPKVKPPGRTKRFFKSITLKRVIIFVVLAIFIIGGYLGFNLAYNIHKLFGGSVFDLFHSTTLKGQASGRINILLAGNSSDDPGHDGANLTDSIMIVSIDTKDNNAFLLSIPRDLWVNVPGQGYQKINDAYVAGQNNNFSAPGYPNGGMGQLEQIVTQDFGIPIDYYALIDYGAIRDAVNAVGGINVNIQSSDPRGLYDPSIDYATHGPLVRLTNGVHTLNGEQALDLARARGDAYGSYGYSQSDFERTANQRKMLISLKQKATSAGVLSNPVKLTSLFNSVGNNVTTDLTLSDVKELYSLTKNLSSIKSLSLDSPGNGQTLITSYVTDDGQDALIPTAGIGNYSQIQHYVQMLISNNPVVKENAPVVFLNATNDTGLAGRQQTAQEAKGLNVVSVGDATSNIANTQIIDLSGNKYPATKAYLESVYGNSVVVTTTNPYPKYSDAAFIVLLGQDQANKDPSSVSSN